MPQHLFAGCYSVEDSRICTYEIRRHNLNHAMLEPGEVLNLHLYELQSYLYGELVMKSPSEICTLFRLFQIIN
jgi:hypothetical protein